MRTDLELQAALYCRFRKQLYVNYMSGANALAAGGIGDTPGEYNTWLPGVGADDCLAADVCSNCGSYFCTTFGGRLRLRCGSCRRTDNSIDLYQIQQLALIWRCSTEFAEYLLAEEVYAASKFEIAIALQSINSAQVPAQVAASEASEQGA